MKKRYYIIALAVFFVCAGLFLFFHRLSYRRTCHNNIEKVMERCYSGADAELLEELLEKQLEDGVMEGEGVVAIDGFDEAMKEAYGNYMTDEALEGYASDSIGSLWSQYEDVKLDSIEIENGDTYVFDCTGTGMRNGKEETLRVHGRAQCNGNGKIEKLTLQPVN